MALLLCLVVGAGCQLDISILFSTRMQWDNSSSIWSTSFLTQGSWRSQGAKAEAPPSLQSPALRPTRGSYLLLVTMSHRASPDARRWRNGVYL